MRFQLNNKSTLLILLVLAMLFISACGNGSKNEADSNSLNKKSGTLVVYSSRNEKFVKPLLEQFTAETGIKVKELYADEQVINRIKEESKNTQADLIISNDVGALEFLRSEGLLQPSNPEGIETIDAKYRAEDNSWFGLSARTRIFMYNKDLVSAEELPRTLWDLTDPKWKGQFAITRGGNGSFVAHVSALRNVWGDEKTLEWLTKIKENAGTITKGHGEIRQAVGMGEYKFGLVNNYYYHQQLNEPEHNNVAALYPDQGSDDIGVFVNAAGIGLIKNAPNETNALYFLDWILKPENQKQFSFESMEVPLNPDVQTIDEAQRISDYKTMSMPLSELGKVWSDTKAIIEKSGLDLEIR